MILHRKDAGHDERLLDPVCGRWEEEGEEEGEEEEDGEEEDEIED